MAFNAERVLTEKCLPRRAPSGTIASCSCRASQLIHLSLYLDAMLLASASTRIDKHCASWITAWMLRSVWRTELSYETTSPGRCMPSGSRPFHHTMPRIYTSLARRSDWMIRLIVCMRLCSAGDKKCSVPSMITASLRRTYLSAWLAVVYFALPGCGFAILIFGIVGIIKSGSAGVF